MPFGPAIRKLDDGFLGYIEGRGLIFVVLVLAVLHMIVVGVVLEGLTKAGISHLGTAVELAMHSVLLYKHLQEEGFAFVELAVDDHDQHVEREDGAHNQAEGKLEERAS